jgi:hypothetical protein
MGRIPGLFRCKAMRDWRDCGPERQERDAEGTRPSPAGFLFQSGLHSLIYQRLKS